jgi:hypothetical protein
VTHLLQQPSVGSYERIGWGPAAVDLSWRVHATTSVEAESEAKRNLEWLVGETWSVELTGETQTLASFEADQVKSGRLTGWWNGGLTPSQQNEALSLNHHSAVPDWMVESLSAAGIPVMAGGWPDGEGPTQFLMPREVADYLDRRRGGSED